MNVAEGIDVVRTRYKDLVETPYSLVSIHDNEKEEPPVDDIYARVTIVTVPSTLESMGNPQRWRNRGGLIVELHTPINLGDKELKDMSAIVLDLFRGKKAGGITYRNANLSIDGSPDGKTWQHTISVEYFHDEFKPLS